MQLSCALLWQRCAWTMCYPLHARRSNALHALDSAAAAQRCICVRCTPWPTAPPTSSLPSALSGRSQRGLPTLPLTYPDDSAMTCMPCRSYTLVALCRESMAVCSAILHSGAHRINRTRAARQPLPQTHQRAAQQEQGARPHPQWAICSESDLQRLAILTEDAHEHAAKQCAPQRSCRGGRQLVPVLRLLHKLCAVDYKHSYLLAARKPACSI